MSVVPSKLSWARIGACWLILFVCWLVEAGPLLWRPGDTFMMDTLTLDIPARVSAARQIRGGELPVRNTGILCGYSPISEGQTGVFYPGFLLYVVSPSAHANDWYIALHLLLLATTFFAYWVRRSGAVLAATLGSLVVTNSQILKIDHGNSGSFAILSLLPLAFLFMESAVERKSLRHWLVLSVLNALMLLTGVPNATIIVYLLQLLYLVYLVGVTSPTRLAWGVFWTFLLPVGLAAVQIIPLYGYYAASNRSSGASWETITSRIVSPWFFWPVSYLDPSTTGYARPDRFVERFWDVVFGMGLLAGGLSRGERSWRIFWVGLGAVFYLGATNALMLRLLHSFPVASWFQWPQAYLGPAAVAGFLLATRGFVVAERVLATFPVARQLVMVATIGLVFASDGMRKYLSEPGLYDSGIRAAAEVREDAERPRVWPNSHVYAKCARERRVNSANLGIGMTMLPGNTNLLHDIDHPFQNEILDTVSPRALSELYRVSQQSSRAFLNVARMTSTTHVTSIDPLNFHWLLEQQVMPTYRYRVKEPLERAWMVTDARLIADANERLQFIASEAFDPARTAIVERPMSEFSAANASTTRGSAVFEVYQPTTISLVAKGEETSFLVISESFSPYWRATLDGVRVPVERVNHAFVGVVVPAGAHRVELRYVPWDFYIGLLVSLVCVGAWIILFALARPARPFG